MKIDKKDIEQDYDILASEMDRLVPGWRDGKDKRKVQKRLWKAAKLTVKNRMEKAEAAND